MTFSFSFLPFPFMPRPNIAFVRACVRSCVRPETLLRRLAEYLIRFHQTYIIVGQR